MKDLQRLKAGSWLRWRCRAHSCRLLRRPPAAGCSTRARSLSAQVLIATVVITYTTELRNLAIVRWMSRGTPAVYSQTMHTTSNNWKGSTYASTIFTLIVLPEHAPVVSPSSEPVHLTLKHCYVAQPPARMANQQRLSNAVRTTV